jgi:hypothetical protein
MSADADASNINVETHSSRVAGGEPDVVGRNGSGRSRTPIVFSRSRSRNRVDENRPGTARRFSRSKSRSRGEGDKPKRRFSRSRARRRTGSSSKFEDAAPDLADLPPPRLTQLDCSNVPTDTSMIGVAVGSPSQLQPTNMGAIGHSPLAKMEAELLETNDDYFEDPRHKAKGGKWKKIGGLFKAKNAFQPERAPSPFYQLQAQYAAQMANQSQTSIKSHSLDQPAQQDPKLLFDKLLRSDGQLSPSNCAENTKQQMQGSLGVIGTSMAPTEHTKSHQPTNLNTQKAGLSLLDVKIPEIQMERYSVMFGNLLDKPDSPGLSARRGRAPNKLLAISDEEETSEPAKHEGQKQDPSQSTSNVKDQSHLAPRAHTTHPRRATSPIPSKSPSFSLFPHLPQAPEKIVGPTVPGGNGPLQRSHTAPGRLSPMQETFDAEEVQSLKPGISKGDTKVVTSPPPTASTSGHTRNPSIPSVVSQTSTRSSFNEDTILNIRFSDSLMKSPESSETVDDEGLVVPPLKPRHLVKHAPTQSIQYTSAETEVTQQSRTDTHEDTLAALERPRSITAKSRDASNSLKPSKARIDEIMGGQQRKELPNSTTYMTKEQVGVKPQVPSSDREQQQWNPKPPATRARGSAEIKLSASSAIVSPKEPQITATTQTREASTTVDTHLMPGQEARQMRQQTKTSQLPPQNFPHPPNATQRPAPNTTYHPRNAFRNDQNYAPNPTYHPPQIGRRPLNPVKSQPQRRPPPIQAFHRPTPNAMTPPNRPPLNASNQSFPAYRPPPQNFSAPLQAPYNCNPVNPEQRPAAKTTPAPISEKDQDNILDYYLDDNGPNPPSQSKSPKKLQKRPSDKARKRLSLSSKPLPFPKTEEKPSPSQNNQRRSPVPTSKYSAQAAAIQKSIISSPVTSISAPHGRHNSVSHSSDKATHADLRILSPAVRAAREKAAALTKASTSMEDLSLTHTRSSSVSSPPSRPPRAEFSFIVEDPKSANTETSFYSHSNASTPSLSTMLNSRPETPAKDDEEKPPPIPRRSPSRSRSRSRSRGDSLSSIPPAEMNPVPVLVRRPSPPQQPVRSASGGTVGTGADIHTHIKPEKGEKVVERQDGLVPTIVGAERGHRAGRSVNLVIESI